MTQKIKGMRLEIWFAEDDPQSNFKEALGRWRANTGQQKRLIARMTAQLQLLADTGQLRSPDKWNTESTLPNDKHYYAVKMGKIRAYGWYSNKQPGVFYISHFAFKRGQKLHNDDHNRVTRNWNLKEGGER